MGGQSPSDVRISYRHPGTKPPIFVAGSFTSSPWEPQELKYVKKIPGSEEDAGEETEECDHEFFADYKVGEGKYQYKFRVGYGDWWVCDERSETATDEAGNRNNVLTVQAKPQLPVSGPTHPAEIKEAPKASKEPSEDSHSTDVDQDLSCSSSPRHEFAPLFPHESSDFSKVDGVHEALSRKPEGSTSLDSRLASRVDDPTLEYFPVETEKILQQIETTKLRVKEDETSSVKGSPASPAINSKHGLATPPSSNDISPALMSISEEDLAEVPAGQQTLSSGMLQADGAQETEFVDETTGRDDTSSVSLAKDDPHSPTPSKIPTEKEKNGSFLQSLVRLVFVDFLGGLYASFCGRRRHE